MSDGRSNNPMCVAFVEAAIEAGHPANDDFNVPEAGGFASSSSDQTTPDLRFHAAPVMFVDGGLGAPTAHALALAFGADVTLPRSRGSVMLAGAEPTAKPRISNNFFAEESDMDVAVVALRVSPDIARQRALRLRVVGVDALRVVDASVMPTVFGNPNAPIIAIAERAADLIRGVPVMPATARAVAV